MCVIMIYRNFLDMIYMVERFDVRPFESLIKRQYITIISYPKKFDALGQVWSINCALLGII